MAATGNTPIQLYYSNTSGNVPVASNLLLGELAINVPDGKLFYLNSANVVSVLASASDNVRISAAFTQANAAYNTANSKYSSSGGTINGNVNIAGTLAITSNTLVANLNSDLLDGKHVGTSGSAIAALDGANIWGGTQRFTNNIVVTGSSGDSFVRITQTGTGNALIVEDETNPDSSPFVVDANGSVGIGVVTPSQKLEVSGNTKINGALETTVGIKFPDNVTQTVGIPSVSGKVGQFLSTDGTTISWNYSPGVMSQWTVKTSNYTAVNRDQIIANTAAGSFTVTLPALPTIGTEIAFVDGANWSVNNLIINNNGSTISGVNDVLNLNIGHSAVTLVYDGSTWQIYSTAGPKGDINSASIGSGLIYSSGTLSTDIVASIGYSLIMS
jgi:hypothetical protein